MKIALMIALGGGLGALARYALSLRIHRFLGTGYPWGIFIVNLLGCFCIGLLATLLVERLQAPLLLRAFILIGFLGGFTTFSSFSLDAYQLIMQGAWVLALTYVIGTVLLGLAATFFGVFLGMQLLA